MKFKVKWSNRDGVQKTVTLNTRGNAIKLMDVLLNEYGYRDVQLETQSTREVVIHTHKL